MPYNIIPVFIILACLFILAILVVKKFPQLSMMDVSTLPQEMDKKIKKKILEARLERIFKKWFGKMAPTLKQCSLSLQRRFQGLYQKISLLEKKYQKQNAPPAPVIKNISVSKSLVDDASILYKAGDFSAAEEKYIEMLAVDSHQSAPYRGLLDIYVALKDWDKAIQTALYLLKLLEEKHQKAEVCAILGDIYQKQGNMGKASEYFLQAVQFQDRNPRYLDLLLGVSIILENKDLALETFGALHTVNPENTKLEAYKVAIEELIVKKAVAQQQETKK